MAILYVETNFLIGLALGQDPEAQALVEAASGARFELAIPQVCVMEAVTAFRKKVIERLEWSRRLESEVNELRRCQSSPVAERLRDQLSQSKVTNDEYINQVLYEFQQAIVKVGGASRMFSFDQDHLESQLSSGPIPSGLDGLVLPDNFILSNIIRDASFHPSRTKGFLSGNAKDFRSTAVRESLKQAGISKYFERARDSLGWLLSLPKT